MHLARGPKDHINTRILHSDSKAHPWFRNLEHLDVLPRQRAQSLRLEDLLPGGFKPNYLDARGNYEGSLKESEVWALVLQMVHNAVIVGW